MKNTIMALALGLAGWTACAPQNNTTNSSDPAAGDTTLVADTAHTSQVSLDWAGMYKGVVPCADCEGIETTVVLNADQTYLLRTAYLGKPDALASEKTGAFTWNTAGNTVVLSGLENTPNQYFVGENQLIQLDLGGNKITGDLAQKYVLMKQ